MVSKIEQAIAEIQDYVDSCKFVAFSSTEIRVNKDMIDDLLEDLRQKAPSEIKQYQQIISNKEAIMTAARNQANEIRNEANMYKDHMTSENSILQNAYARAAVVEEEAKSQGQAIVDGAFAQANEIKIGAMIYTDKTLEAIQGIIAQSLQDIQMTLTGYTQSLSSILAQVNENRAQLQATQAVGSSVSMMMEGEAAAKSQSQEGSYQSGRGEALDTDQARPQIES